MTWEQWLAARGHNAATITAEQTVSLRAQFDAEQKGNPAPTPAPLPTPAPTPIAAAIPVAQPVMTPEQYTAQMRAAAAAEQSRQDAIREIVARRQVERVNIMENGQTREVSLLAHAIASNWNAERTELEALRAERPHAPNVFSHGHERDCTLEVLQAAALLTFGGRLDHPAYQRPLSAAMKLSPWLRAGINDSNRNRIMDAAHRYSHMTALDICREACRLSGRQAPSDRHELIQAAMSGGTLTNIFTDSVNARLLATYTEAGDTTMGWTQETDVPDFKTNTDIRLTKAGGLRKHPRGSTADHESRSDSAETYKIGRYSKQFVMDEQDFIDDNLGALADVPVEMGLGAARLRPDLVYSVLLANPTLSANSLALFHATNDNIDTTSALSSANLKQGIANMNVKQENGVNLNFNPTHLIVPSTLRFPGKELISSSQILIARGGSTDTTVERGSNNVLADEALTLVSDARLENGVTDPNTGTAYSGSASTWYLACALAKTILVAYLRGTGRAPQTRSFVLSQGEWGMGWDINMDIGAKARDWRGLYRATA